MDGFQQDQNLDYVVFERPLMVKWFFGTFIVMKSILAFVCQTMYLTIKKNYKRPQGGKAVIDALLP